MSFNFSLSGLWAFVGSGWFLFGATIVTELMFLALLPLVWIGTWQALMLLKPYLVLTRLGIINGYNREYPALFENSEADRRTLTSALLSFMIVNVLLVFTAAASLYLFLDDFAPAHVVIAAAIVLSLETLSSYFATVARAKQVFAQITKANAITALIVLASSPVILIFENQLLFVWRYVLIALLYAALLVIFVGVETPTANISALKKMFGSGWKLWIWSYCRELLRSVPRVIVLMNLGAAGLAVFMPVHWYFLAIVSTSGMAASYLYPQVVKNTVKDPVQSIKDSLNNTSKILFKAMPFVCAAILGIMGALFLNLTWLELIGLALMVVSIQALVELILLNANFLAANAMIVPLFLFVALSALAMVIAFATLNAFLDNVYTIASLTYFAGVSASASYLIYHMRRRAA